MKLRIKTVLLTLLVVGSMCWLTACGGDKTPYEVNDEKNYTVSVKFDANGGVFTTNTSVILDSYNISDMQADEDGYVEIPLITPDDEARGNDAFKATKSGYFLAGWYAERSENGKDEDGNTLYTYGEKWDFEDDYLEVVVDKEYSSQEPVLTLYAAWVPLFEIEFYSLEDGKLIDTYVYDPTVVKEIKAPALDEKTGAMKLYNFPERDGYTYQGAYYDEEGTEPIASIVEHYGDVDRKTGTAEDTVMKVYVDWMEGEWYHIYTVEQFLENASIKGNYEIHADLDFSGETWPSSLMYGKFTGTIKGNGHKFTNIEFKQTNNSKANAGLFGNITKKASITDLTFENVTFTIEKGTRVTGTAYGLFAGTIDDEATISNVNITNGVIQIDSNCYFGASDYSIGLVCGSGNAAVVSNAQITCVPTGDNPELVQITVEGNDVTVEISK
ncbi:MAG: hypothetical protein IJ455_03265 [Agathobacter sp.]|nr:hypothetical protein [Agathobacter sp.]